MRCDHFELSVDHKTYFNKELEKRRKVFFYARPATPRRGFEIGIKALEIFAKRNPKFEILLAGQKLSGLRLNFPFTDVGYVTWSKLNDIYNECAVALIISLTNYSLLPLEIMAAGCPVVTNFGENNEKNLPEESVIYSHLSPFHFVLPSLLPSDLYRWPRSEWNPDPRSASIHTMQKLSSEFTLTQG